MERARTLSEVCQTVGICAVITNKSVTDTSQAGHAISVEREQETAKDGQGPPAIEDCQSYQISRKDRMAFGNRIRLN
jgi:hypothetical protein